MSDATADPGAEARRPARDAGPVPRRSLAELLERLFATIRPSEAAEYSNEHVARAIEAAGGPTISSVYIWQLRKGARDNPTKRHLEALADFFGVPASYFFDENIAKEVESELRLMSALRDAKIRNMVFRAQGLSSDALDAVTTLIDSARRVEKIDPPDKS